MRIAIPFLFFQFPIFSHAYDLCEAVRREWKIPLNDSSLVVALNGSDTVFIKKDFDLTKFGEIKINCVVYSNGAILTSHYSFGESMRQFSGFLVMGKKSLLSGLKIIGRDSSYRFLNGIFSTGIFVNGDSAKIENCIISGWGYCDIWLRRSQGVVISDCIINQAKLSGYGYGIWIASNGIQGWTTIRNCTFSDCREALGSSGANAWDFVANKIEQGCGAAERHNSIDSLKLGGLSCIIDSNFFYGGGYDIPIPVPDTGNIYIRGNYFAWDSIGSGFRYSPAKPSFKPIAYGNHYGMNWMGDCTDYDSIQIDTGGSVISFIDGTTFTLGNGSKYIGVRCFKNGISNLWNYSKISDPSVLSASVKFISDCDSCYQIQLLIDDSVIRQTRERGWTKWILPTPKGYHKITVRLYCAITTSLPVYAWLDDVDCAGLISNSGFENGVAGWRLITQGNGANFVSYEWASGKQALCLKWVSGAKKGMFCGVSFSGNF